MLKTADHNIFFRPPDSLCAEYPDVPVVREHSELLAHIEALSS